MATNLSWGRMTVLADEKDYEAINELFGWSYKKKDDGSITISMGTSYTENAYTICEIARKAISEYPSIRKIEFEGTCTDSFYGADGSVTFKYEADNPFYRNPNVCYGPVVRLFDGFTYEEYLRFTELTPEEFSEERFNEVIGKYIDVDYQPENARDCDIYDEFPVIWP